MKAPIRSFPSIFLVITSLDTRGLEDTALWTRLIQDGYPAFLEVAETLLRCLRAQGVLEPSDVAQWTILNLTRRFWKRETFRFGQYSRAAGNLSRFLGRTIYREARTIIVRALIKSRRESQATDESHEPTTHRWSPADEANLVGLINGLPVRERSLAALVLLQHLSPDQVMARMEIGRSTYFKLHRSMLELLRATFLDDPRD